MTHWKPILALAVCLMVPAMQPAFQTAQSPANAQGPTVTGNPAPSPQQIHDLILRAVDNQHRDDRELQEFERTERVITRKSENGEVLTDITERELPSGTGTFKLKTMENGVAVSPEEYRHELESAVEALGLSTHPNERYTEDQAKFERRQREHAELVDAATKAFRATWAGRETRRDSAGASRTLDKFLLEPDPDFRPTTRFSVSFAHVRARLWVDEGAAQFVRMEADIVTDISFGGGVAGKVYHGGHIVMEQAEAAPGIWLPTLYDYEVDGRKFLFAFSVHERSEISRYRHAGPPAQSVALLRDELNNLSAQTPAK